MHKAFCVLFSTDTVTAYFFVRLTDVQILV